MKRLHAAMLTAASLALLAGAPADVFAPFGSGPAFAQRTPGGCVPKGQRKEGELGCVITAIEELGALPQGPVYWHLDVFPTRAAAEAAKDRRGSIVESYGRIWLFTIADAEWRPAGGERITRIGPMQIETAGDYKAQYLEGTFPPGMYTAVHRHAGPEAWYTLEGEQCVETPDGKFVVRAGEGAYLRGGVPHKLTGTGASLRRSVALILHDPTQPAIIPVKDWQPKELCGS